MAEAQYHAIERPKKTITASTPDELPLKGMDAYDAADYVKALKYFRDAANQGNGWAQYYLVRMFYEGYGVSKDFQKALKWFEKAAKVNVPNSTKQFGTFCIFEAKTKFDYYGEDRLQPVP